MGRWGYARVYLSTGIPELKTTEPSLVNEVLDELKKLIPSARILYRNRDHEKLGDCYVRFDRLEGLHEAVPFWIVAKLCKLGWEPFSGSEFRRYYGPEETLPTAH